MIKIYDLVFIWCLKVLEKIKQMKNCGHKKLKKRPLNQNNLKWLKTMANTYKLVLNNKSS